MTSDASLGEQRHKLREQLKAQRELIARELEPPPNVHGVYPRSKTMRFLTRRPAVTAGVLAGFAAIVVRGRLFKTVTTALGVLKTVQSFGAFRRR